MIGTSLGGTQVTVISHLSADATQVLLTHYEGHWGSATRLKPIERAVAVEEEGPDTARGHPI